MRFNICNYLLDKLNETKAELGFDDFNINVYEERSFEMPKEPNSIVFIIKRITGSNVFNITTQPVQIIAYSELNTMSVASQILELFSRTYNNTSFNEVSEEDATKTLLIKQDYDTVVALRPIVEAFTGFKASLYIFGSFTIIEGLSDLEDLAYSDEDAGINEEPINYLSASLGYSAVLNTTKFSGDEISVSIKQEAGLVLTMTIMNDNSEFCKIINKIMNGEESGNYKFLITYKLGGVEYTGDNYFILQSATLTTNRTDAPGLELTFTR